MSIGIRWSGRPYRVMRSFSKGDLPPTAGAEMNEYRLIYSIPRPLVTLANRVIYTERGMAWVNGRLERRYSFQEVGLKQILSRPGPPTMTLKRPVSCNHRRRARMAIGFQSIWLRCPVRWRPDVW